MLEEYIDQQTMIEKLQACIAIRSLKSKAEPGMPYGREVYRALEYVLNLAAEMGFRGSLCSFRYGFHAFPPGLFLSFILPLFPFFPDPGLCQSKHTPESGQGYEKAGPGHRIPVGLEPAQLKAGDPFPSYPEQGKQGPEMERVPAPPVIIKIQIQGCQDQTHSRHIVMDAGCKKHTGAMIAY